LQDFCSYHQPMYDPKKQLDEHAWAAIDQHAVQLGYEPPSKDAVKVLWHAMTICRDCGRQVWPDDLEDAGCAFCSRTVAIR
jgi:hypothetical protein